jgi:hypothetical protein
VAEITREHAILNAGPEAAPLPYPVTGQRRANEASNRNSSF